MGFSYGSEQQDLQSHKLRNGLVLLAVAIIFYTAGIGTNYAVAKYSTKQLDSTCQAYVGLILKGDLDKAYEQSGQELKANMTLITYKQTLEKLKTSTPEFNRDLKDISVDGSKTGSCVINVDGLPAAPGERTDAVFNISATKSGLGWKVASLSVE